MMRSSLLVFACLALALMAAGEADAKEPLWTYYTDGWDDVIIGTP